jgi:hypothetical protein
LGLVGEFFTGVNAAGAARRFNFILEETFMGLGGSFLMEFFHDTKDVMACASLCEFAS